MFARLWLLIAGVAVALSGCSGDVGGPRGDASAPVMEVSAGSHKLRNEQVDPAIFLDVVDVAAPIPGASGQRMMLVTRELGPLLSQKCYGKGDVMYDIPVGRFDQTRAADLDLITREGFAEEIVDIPEPNETRAYVESDCYRKHLPKYVKAESLRSEWFDYNVEEVHSSPELIDIKRDAASCLKSRSDTSPSDDDPTATFLAQYDGLVVDRLAATDSGREAQSAAYKEIVAEHVPIFVECTGPYFEALTANLEPRRVEFVEKNREVLESAAVEIAALGYVS